MLPALLIALLALTLLLVARRGRRIDDHPLCRRCRFDLTGLPETSPNCPECGRNIRQPHATRSSRPGSFSPLATAFTFPARQPRPARNKPRAFRAPRWAHKSERKGS